MSFETVFRLARASPRFDSCRTFSPQSIIFTRPGSRSQDRLGPSYMQFSVISYPPKKLINLLSHRLVVPKVTSHNGTRVRIGSRVNCCERETLMACAKWRTPRCFCGQVPLGCWQYWQWKGFKQGHSHQLDQEIRAWANCYRQERADSDGDW